MSEKETKKTAGERLAKAIARAGLCSRRDAERWIEAGRVAVNGKAITTPAFNVTPDDRVSVDGIPLSEKRGTRIWLYHKPAGLVVTERDPEGRKTIFDALAGAGLPRVLTIGRLDINTEGLLLLTNDGGLKRVLELPATGWLRRYRVRAHGQVTQDQLDALKTGVTIDGVRYGAIEATLERVQASNVWLSFALREGKNREVKNVLASLGLAVNRLIRVSYGPFQLGDIPVGGLSTVKSRILRDQLGNKLAKAAGVDFDAPMPEIEGGEPQRKPGPAKADPSRRVGRPKRPAKGAPIPRPKGRIGAPRKPSRDDDMSPETGGPTRRVFFPDGRPLEHLPVKPDPADKPGRGPRRGETRGRDGRPPRRTPSGGPRPGKPGAPRGKPRT